MPQSDWLPSYERPTRAFHYDVGAVGALEMRAIAMETPVEIAFGDVPFAVMMATPADLQDFVFGFALTEGVIDSVDDIVDVEVEHSKRSARVNVTLKGAAMSAHLSRKRTLSGRTGCGLCGIEDLAQLRPVPPRPLARPQVAPKAIGAAIENLDKAQPLNALTHTAHAALWCSRDGVIITSREDVGRHNALDKLIGALLRERVDPDAGFIVITSRCSYEMVVKTARFGARTLVAVSAPTLLALETAEAAGVELIAVARRDRALCFLPAEANKGVAA